MIKEEKELREFIKDKDGRVYMRRLITALVRACYEDAAKRGNKAYMDGEVVYDAIIKAIRAKLKQEGRVWGRIRRRDREGCNPLNPDYGRKEKRMKLINMGIITIGIIEGAVAAYIQNTAMAIYGFTFVIAGIAFEYFETRKVK